MAEIQQWLVWVGNVSSIATLIGMVWGFSRWQWQNRKVYIWAVCGDSRKKLDEIPARHATRREVSGIVAQCASGSERLDLSGFNYDFFKIKDIIEVPLNSDDFARLC